MSGIGQKNALEIRAGRADKGGMHLTAGCKPASFPSRKKHYKINSKTLKTQKLQKTLQKDRKGEVVTLPRLLTCVNALLMNFLSAM